MSAIKILPLLLAALVAGPLTAATGPADVFEHQSAALDTEGLTEALPEEAEDILDGYAVSAGGEVGDGLRRVWDAVTGRFDDVFRSGLKSACAIVLCALLCAAAATVTPERHAAVCGLAGVLAIAAVSLLDVNNFLGLGSQTVQSLHDLSTALLPCLSAAAAATGAVTAATAKYAAAALFMNVLMAVQRSVVLPVIYGYVAAGLAGAALGTDALKGATALLKWAAVTVMRGVVLCFVTYLAVTGVIAGSADAARVKLAKTAVSTALPVVGGILSDASETVLAGAALLKNAVGVFGLVATAAVCALPFLRLGVNYLLYKAASALTGALGGRQVAAAAETVCTALGLVLSLTGTAAVMLFLSVVSFMRVVT